MVFNFKDSLEHQTSAIGNGTSKVERKAYLVASISSCTASTITGKPKRAVWSAAAVADDMLLLGPVVKEAQATRLQAM